MKFIIVGVLAAVLTALITPLQRRYALSRHIVDDPAHDPERRVHQYPVALLGGAAIYFTLLIFIFYFTLIENEIVSRYITILAIFGLVLGMTVIMIGGYLDDRFKLSPSRSIIFPIIAALIVVAAGIGVNFVTRPWGGVWRLDGIKWSIFTFGDKTYSITLWADLFTFLWLMGMMYTTKLLDGLDGLVTGLTVIGALIIAGLSLTSVVHQPDTALLAIIIAGAFLGFLWYNWSPASIFLGEGGSLMAGFLLGVLAIIAGGKIATTLLIVGIPVLDVVWVIMRRVIWERKPISRPDRRHLHFRLLDLGLKPSQVVIALWLLSLAWGVPSLFLHTQGKIIALVLLTIGSAVAALIIAHRQKRVMLP